MGATRADFAQFVWEKLSAIDNRLGELSEKHGRVDAKLDSMRSALENRVDGVKSAVEGKIDGVKTTIDLRIDSSQKAVEKLEGKVSKLETTIRWATAVVVVLGVIASAVMGLYKVIDSHITIGWH
ncbi:hypothetical protein [Burkholderia seminalis]|uniref:hypothetical protein n=1 Tax=Burkholderia seminalis TaxID=488731 RepID=UPI00158D115D|nr:hypothetical protein [Burkholderia seminalis]